MANPLIPYFKAVALAALDQPNMDVNVDWHAPKHGEYHLPQKVRITIEVECYDTVWMQTCHAALQKALEIPSPEQDGK